MNVRFMLYLLAVLLFMPIIGMIRLGHKVIEFAADSVCETLDIVHDWAIETYNHQNQ